MRNPKLVPYETIVRATSGEPEAVDEVLRHYGKRIRLDEQPYKKLNKRRPSQRHTKTGNQENVSCFFALIFGVLKKLQYCPMKMETEHALFWQFLILVVWGMKGK